MQASSAAAARIALFAYCYTSTTRNILSYANSRILAFIDLLLELLKF